MAQQIENARILFAGRKWIVARKNFPSVSVGSAEKLVDYCNRNLICVENKDSLVEKFSSQLRH
jgi:hypothetical protein